MTRIGTFVLNLVTGNAVVLKKLELWKVYRLTVARHFQSEKLNWDSGRGELNIDCTYKGSVTRFSIWFSLSKQNHAWTQNLISKYESKCRFKINWSHFHPTIWWESYRENGKRKKKHIKKRMESQNVWLFVHSTYPSLRCDLLEIGSKSYRVIRGDCTLKKHQAATLSYI